MRPPGGILAPGESIIATGNGLALALMLQIVLNFIVVIFCFDYAFDDDSV